MPKRPAVVLFRRDLRLSDNPALDAAVRSGAPLIFLYIVDEAQPFSPGGAARWWLHESLLSLEKDVTRLGGWLTLRRGPTGPALHALIAESNADAVFWNRRYAPAEVEADRTLKAALADSGVSAASFNAALLREPWEARSPNDKPYGVFTPFWKNLRAAGPSRPAPLNPPTKLIAYSGLASEPIEALALQPSRPNWARGFGDVWRPGEHAAKARLDAFLGGGAPDYAARRDFPVETSTSRLSPHLAFGEISPLQIWDAIAARRVAGRINDASAEKFLSELAWREFAYHHLYYSADITTQPIRPSFAAFPYRTDQAAFRAWAIGRTGYPLVDAGMRELRQTGWMHNRVRMITASFLTKHLLISWREGAAWFLDSLVDADVASNAASWQWVAGCGADAAPYFRIFNPVLQGEKFDPNGDYVRKFVPELRHLPSAYIHRPWETPAEVRANCKDAHGRLYPAPIVDHAAARERALSVMNETKSAYAATH